MKTILSILLLVLALGAQAQTQTIRVPLNISVDIPLPASTNNVTTITNNYFVTVTNASTALVPLPTDAVDAKLGIRLIRFVSAPPTFTFTNFGPSAFTTLYWSNPAGFKLNFPTDSVWWLGPMPTNQLRGAVLIEAVGNEYWLTP